MYNDEIWIFRIDNGHEMIESYLFNLIRRIVLNPIIHFFLSSLPPVPTHPPPATSRPPFFS